MIENLNLSEGKNIELIEDEENLIVQTTGSIVVDDVNCKNLFVNGSNIVTPGYIDASGNVVTTDATLSYQNKLIAVKPNTQYTISSNTSTIYRIAEYNQSGTFITRHYNNESTRYTFTTGANTYFIKMAGTLTTVLDSLQIEKGSTATEYVEGKKIIKEENGYVKENTTFYANDFKCINMFDYNSSKFGYVLGGSGAESAANGFLISDYIPVTPNTTYTISRVFNNVSGAENSMRIGYYQQNKTFIDRPASSDNPYTITTPSNCYYVRLSYQYQSQGQTSNDKVQLELGSEATPYTPYKNFENEEITDITSEITFATNWSLTDGKLYKQGNHIFGTLQFHSSVTLAASSNNQEVINLNRNLTTNYISGGFVASSRWSPTTGLCYIFIGNAGKITIVPTSSATEIRMQIDVVEKN